MSAYTSTHAGFQTAMQWSLTGPGSETSAYAEATVLPTFYHVMNGERSEYDAYVKGVAEWRDRVEEYVTKVEEFLRDGDQLAARMTGTLKVDSVATLFESFMFAKVDRETGKMEYLIERSVWGAVGKGWENGVN